MKKFYHLLKFRSGSEHDHAACSQQWRNKPAGFGSGLLKTVLVFLLACSTAYGSHMAGGELTYKWLGGTTYEITATFYRDCAGVNAPATLILNYQSVSCNINQN